MEFHTDPLWTSYGPKLGRPPHVRRTSNVYWENIIVGCIYRHPSMNLEEFNNKNAHLMEKLSKENKKVYIMGDFNH